MMTQRQIVRSMRRNRGFSGVSGLGFGFSPGAMAAAAMSKATPTPSSDGVFSQIDRGAGLYLDFLKTQESEKTARAQAEAIARQSAASARIAAKAGQMQQAAAMSQTTKWLIFGGLAVVVVGAGIMAFRGTRRNPPRRRRRR